MGIEYKNLPDFEAETFENANCLAEEIAKKILGGPRTIISEVKVQANSRFWNYCFAEISNQQKHCLKPLLLFF